MASNQSRGIASDAGQNVTAQPLGGDATAGVATLGDRAVVFDLREGRLKVMNWGHDSTLRAFGATGGGPGEFVSYGQSEYLRQYPVHWVDARQDTIVAFDGFRLSRFNAFGGFLGAYIVPVDLRHPMVRVGNVRLWKDKVLVGSYSTGAMVGSRRWLAVRAITSGTSEVVAEVPLAPLPLSRAGRPFHGLAEATPSWDLMGNCIVATDGHSDSLRVTDISTGRTVVRMLELPKRFRPVATESETKLLSSLGGGKRDLPTTKNPARVSTVITDPSGWVWLRPSVRSEGLAPRVEVWRLHLRSGNFRVDTVPFFPLAFDVSGCALGIGEDEQSEPQLLRACGSF